VHEWPASLLACVLLCLVPIIVRRIGVATGFVVLPWRGMLHQLRYPNQVAIICHISQ
jgi:hypothetical protein